MLAGSNPAARTSQSQSPRSPYRGAGRLFCTRFAGSMAFRRCPIMTSCFSFPIPSRLSNCDMLLSSLSPRLPSRFPAPPYRRVLFDPPCRSPIRFGGTRCRRLPHYVVPFPIGGKVRLPLRSPFSIRPIGFSPFSSPRFPPDGSVSFLFAFLYDRRGGSVFFVCIFVFPVDFAAACDTLIDIHAGVVEWQTRQI